MLHTGYTRQIQANMKTHTHTLYIRPPPPLQASHRAHVVDEPGRHERRHHALRLPRRQPRPRPCSGGRSFARFRGGPCSERGFRQEPVISARDFEERQAAAGDGPEVVGALHQVRQRRHPTRHVLPANQAAGGYAAAPPAHTRAATASKQEENSRVIEGFLYMLVARLATLLIQQTHKRISHKRACTFSSARPCRARPQTSSGVPCPPKLNCQAKRHYLDALPDFFQKPVHVPGGG